LVLPCFSSSSLLPRNSYISSPPLLSPVNRARALHWISSGKLIRVHLFPFFPPYVFVFSLCPSGLPPGNSLLPPGVYMDVQFPRGSYLAAANLVPGNSLISFFLATKDVYLVIISLRLAMTPPTRSTLLAHFRSPPRPFPRNFPRKIPAPRG